MTTRIGIIANTPNLDTVTVALYFVANAAKKIAKPGFVPSFPPLASADVSLCQSGDLIEVVKVFNYSGWTLAAARVDLQAQWNAMQASVVAASGANFDVVGRFWDGTIWS